jgi:hypothetical protein
MNAWAGSIVDSILDSIFEECAVCYEYTLPTEKLSCGHRIHMDCIYKSGAAKCPLCRKQLLLNREQNSHFSHVESEGTVFVQLIYYGSSYQQNILQLRNAHLELEEARTLILS